ncbi:hypothetical protein ARAM_003339 [Aspergillus rambellii]|uniref:DUF7707 domain-containing protein n=1 Tax=Aspergillus rambellii TaxID=308745 RepID=A0A0F8UXA4_9EURO|nr:hypothetical protein ARAM_003339 [Aspergillus rambellii]
MYSLLLFSLFSPILANYTFPTGFDVSEISANTKASWCLGELNSCPELCGGSAQVNHCDSSTLDFTCTCSNGSTADVALYQQTIPFYVCQANYGQCIARSSTQEEDATCKEGLSECGTLNASSVSTSTSSSSTTTTTTTATQTSTATDSASTTTTAASTTHTGAAVQLLQNHGVAVFATVMLGVLVGAL